MNKLSFFDLTEVKIYVATLGKVIRTYLSREEEARRGVVDGETVCG